MTKETYQEALNAALKDLASLMHRREKVDMMREKFDREIFQLREGLFGLAILCGTDTNQLAKDNPELFPDLISPDVGLTDAVRKAMAAKRIFTSPVEVKDRLAEMGFDITIHKNILASIHTILKRLVKSEEVDEGQREGKVVYRWKGAAQPDTWRAAADAVRQADAIKQNAILAEEKDIAAMAKRRK